MRLVLSETGSPNGQMLVLVLASAEGGRPNVAGATVDIGGRIFSGTARGTGPVVAVTPNVPVELLADMPAMGLRLALRGGRVVELTAGTEQRST